MPRPPLSKLREATILGRVLDVIFKPSDGQAVKLQLSWKPVLIFNADPRYLLFSAGGSITRPRGETSMKGKAADVYRTWSKFEPTRLRMMHIPRGISMKDKGRALTIGYSSDKWGGKWEDYEHKFTSPVRLWHGNKTKQDVWALYGGTLRVTADGIEG